MSQESKLILLYSLTLLRMCPDFDLCALTCCAAHAFTGYPASLVSGRFGVQHLCETHSKDKQGSCLLFRAFECVVLLVSACVCVCASLAQGGSVALLLPLSTCPDAERLAQHVLFVLVPVVLGSCWGAWAPTSHVEPFGGIAHVRMRRGWMQVCASHSMRDWARTTAPMLCRARRQAYRFYLHVLCWTPLKGGCGDFCVAARGPN